MTVHRFHTSRPHTSIRPRQTRWADWGHGQIQPINDDYRMPRSCSLIGVGMCSLALWILIYIAIGGAA